MTLATTPEEIIAFWFPDGPSPEPAEHLNLWMWRMRGGADDTICANFADLTEAAANLFRYMHRLDAEHEGTIAVSPIPETGLGVAINDRLRRAAAPRN